MVSYESMSQQIERVVSEYLAEANGQNINASKPLLSYKQGIISLSFKVEKFSRGEILSVIDILDQYYEHFPGLEKRILNEYQVIAELKKDWLQRLKDKDQKRNRMKVSFGHDTFRESYSITFEKEAELGQDEINCFLDVWRRYALRDKASEKSTSESLSELGALVYEADQEFTWDSIAGYNKTKQEIRDTIVLPFKHPEIYRSIGELTRTHFSPNIPRAVLFEGPPGTGKTTMARIIANESGVPLVYVPIESIMSMWYGVAENNLSSIFDHCGKFEKSMIFLDEIDSLAGSRDRAMHEATRRILSVLLRKMQGFVSVENVLTIGATNRVADLDDALLSRFNRTVTFHLPEQYEREAIFHYYAKHLDAGNLKKLAESTDKSSGRDIEDICGDAERLWASKIIIAESEVTPPPIETYLEAINFKFNNK